MRTVWMMLLVVSAAVAGCAEGEGEPVSDAEKTGQDDGNETAGDAINGTVGQAPNGTVVNTPPTAAINASVANGTVPFDVTLSLDGSDADGDALAWNVTRNGTQIANGTGLPAEVNITIVEGGNHTFTLAVDDGTNQTTQSVTVVAVAKVVHVVDIDDASGDAAVDVDALDVTRLQAEVTGGKLEVLVTVVDLPTGADTPGFVPWKYRLYVGEHQFQNFNYVGPDIWDTTNGEYIGGATWDPGADTIGFSIDVSRLEGLGLSAPFAIKLESATGNLSATPHETVDWAPDAGTVLVG